MNVSKPPPGRSERVRLTREKPLPSDRRGDTKRSLTRLEPLTIDQEQRFPCGQQPPGSLAGGYIVGATPVPIPNTAVKPDKPMILPQRESRSPPAFSN